ncbi:hypothetical protein CHS0354_028606 [Potamilus streckersoni]|uniref:Uncharacterized protein n=1 Tax=Potamilus streckersoni TaxID=2493646 RepID=A0AAE0S6R3_9BIVA|nr:hypothetical protein CHS0354_028606 [Potamilus streckersoni]
MKTHCSRTQSPPGMVVVSLEQLVGFLRRGNYIISDPDMIPNDHFMASSNFGELHDSYKLWLTHLNSEEIFGYPNIVYRCGFWAAKDLDKLQFIQTLNK